MTKKQLALLILIVSAGLLLYSLWHNIAEAPVSLETLNTTVSPASVAATSSTPSASSTESSTSTPVATSTGTPRIPTNTFTGTLEQVDTGCFADGECFVVVSGKKVTVTIGRKQEVLGSIVGAPSIGDLETYIGTNATVYAAALPDGTYTLYGNSAYYVAVPPKATTGCVVGGCSSQLCVPAGEDVVSTCEWTEKYNCYQTATCEKQADGQCGWTETPALRQCLIAADGVQ
jgi:hypothetical protein